MAIYEAKYFDYANSCLQDRNVYVGLGASANVNDANDGIFPVDCVVKVGEWITARSYFICMTTHSWEMSI